MSSPKKPGSSPDSTPKFVAIVRANNQRVEAKVVEEIGARLRVVYTVENKNGSEELSQYIDEELAQYINKAA